MHSKKKYRIFAQKNKKRMNTAEAYNNIHLAIMAIERGAQLMKVSPTEMYMRLKAQGLIHNFLLPYYEELHSQSVDWLAATTAETLKNWEICF